MMGPDPDQQTLAGVDLRDALHVRPQLWRRPVEARFDVKAIDAVSLFSDRRNPDDVQTEGMVWQSRQDERASALWRYTRNFAVGDADDHAIAVERCYLEQYLRPLHRHAHGLAEIAVDDQPIEWRDDFGTCELRIQQCDLGNGFGDLCRIDVHLGTRAGRQRLVQLRLVLLARGDPAEPLHVQFGIVQCRQQLSLMHDLAGPGVFTAD